MSISSQLRIKISAKNLPELIKPDINYISVDNKVGNGLFSLFKHSDAETVVCSDFGACSATCGSGTQTCQNTCQRGTWGDPGCESENQVNSQSCNEQACPGTLTKNLEKFTYTGGWSNRDKKNMTPCPTSTGLPNL